MTPEKMACCIVSKGLSIPQSNIGDYPGISVAGILALASKGRLIMKKREIEVLSRFIVSVPNYTITITDLSDIPCIIL